MKHLVDCLHYTSNFLNDIGVKYWMDFASLLGFHRDKRIIPWDKDVDFSIMSEDASRILMHYNKIRNDGYHPMYRLHKDTYLREELPFKNGNIEVVKFFISQQNRLHSDMYCCTENNGKIIRMNPSWTCTTFDANLVNNLKKVKFYNCNVYVPEHIEDYLKLLYGENFMEYPAHRIADINHFNSIRNVYDSRGI